MEYWYDYRQQTEGNPSGVLEWGGTGVPKTAAIYVDYKRGLGHSSRVVKPTSRDQSPEELDQTKNLKSKTTSLCSEHVHSVTEP